MSPHTKAFLLLYYHLSHFPLPVNDYVTDTKSVLDQAVRIIHAMVDISADGGWLFASLRLMNLMQMILQGRWLNDSSLLTLPHFTVDIITKLTEKGITCLPELMALSTNDLLTKLSGLFNNRQMEDIKDVVAKFPKLDLKFKLTSVVINDDGVLEISLKRLGKGSSKGAYIPHFPKPKDEGWWLVLGDPETAELLAMKRVNFKGETKTNLSFAAPEKPGSYSYALYCISDCYLGLDLQYNVTFTL